MSQAKQERLSIFIDDGLGPEESAAALDELCNDPQLRAAWDRYHLIGDALRGEPISRDVCSVADRVREQLEREPKVVKLPLHRPRVRWVAPAAGTALAASVALVAIVAGPQFFDAGRGPGSRVAVNQAPNQAPSPKLYQDRRGSHWSLQRPEVESKLNSFLVNHQEYVPSSGMKGMLPYATLVSYDARR